MARRRQLAGEVPDAVLLDSEGLSAGAQGDARVRAELTVAEQLGARVHVSSVTLAEVLRGQRRDARVHSLLSAVEKVPVTPELGRAAGELLGRTGRDDTVDAVVAVTAQSVGRLVRLLTGDPADLRALTADMPGVTVVPI
ncbi:MAG: type II toxin-antitoxin system VapC family toxin [Acidimicrobiales bacterium]